MPEGTPEFRIVGNAPEEEKEKTREKLGKKLYDHVESLPPEAKKMIAKLEYEKSPEEIEILNFANRETSVLMEEVGVKAYDVPLENFHIIPPDLYRKTFNTGGGAVARPIDQTIAFNAQEYRGNPLLLGAAAVHELLHLKGHLSLEVGISKDKLGEFKTTPYRQGVTARSSQRFENEHGDGHGHFVGLHEAIVSLQEKKLLGKLLEQPVVAFERTRLDTDAAKELKKKISKEKRVPEDDIYWVGDNEKEYNKVHYPWQREVLLYVCSEIQKQFPDEYPTPDQVFKDFLRAHFSGQLLSIARLIERTFGTGSFRVLGNYGCY